MQEMNVASSSNDICALLSSPFPGIVRLEGSSLPLFANNDNDFVYALQLLSNAVLVSAPSIKGIAKQIQEQLVCRDGDNATILRQAPRGSLSLHALVPGMAKGQVQPQMQRRANMIAAELVGSLKRQYAAARPAPQSSNDKFLIQILLVSPEIAVASFTKCAPMTIGYWPNPLLPAGLANVELPDSYNIPSSAYRKLLEAFTCMRITCCADHVVDLGAAPGGWTGALRRLGCGHVIAVDKSELASYWMKDVGVEFIAGDAFSYTPPWADTTPSSDAPLPNSWMVSDIIAYPERILALLERWCFNRWAGCMIVTLKFQGQSPDWVALQSARDIAERHGYHFRAKHFFNNKNEVTMMLRHALVHTQGDRPMNADILDRPIYPVALPVPNNKLSTLSGSGARVLYWERS
jgi:hypothetical protein